MSTKLPSVLVKTPMIDENGILTPVWADWFIRLYERVGGPVNYSNTELSANQFVTFARMQNIGTDKLIGRDTAGTGSPEELSVGGGLEFTGSGGIQTSAFTGDVTKAAGGTATTIGASTVSFSKLLASDWLFTFGASGYAKIGNGLYIQWGVTGSVTSGSTQTVTFPTAFPTACRQVFVTIRDNSAIATTATGQVGSGNYSTTAADLYNRTSVSQVMNWVALGN